MENKKGENEMLTEWAKYQLELNRIPVEDVDEVSADMEVTFKDGTKRRICEIYTRCMGYFRRTSDFNKGKYSEFASRTPYKEPEGGPDDAA